MISHERAALIDFLATGKPGDVAGFVARTRGIRKDIQRFYGPELDMQALIGNLKSKNTERIEGVRELLDDYLELRSSKLPAFNLPISVRRIASKQEAKSNFNKAVGHFKYGNVFGGVVNLASAALSAFGLTARERQLTMGVGLAAMMTSAFSGHAQAAISQQDVNSMLNDFNSTSHSDTITPLRITVSGSVEDIEAKSDYLLSPYLVQKLEKSSEAREYMALIIDAAEVNGIDPVLFANQLFRETRHFKHNVIYGPDVSPAGAMGFGQFMEYNGASYGLNQKADFFNPEKAIYAAARMMSDLTEDYNDDQILAMAAYNGGDEAVNYVREQLNNDGLTGQEWLDFMNKRYAEIGVTSKTAWHVETRAYIADITGQDWDSGYKEWAMKLQGPDAMEYVQHLSSRAAALDAIDNAVAEPPVPMPSPPGQYHHHRDR